MKVEQEAKALVEAGLKELNESGLTGNIEVERNELTTNTSENFIPFEILKGNVIGKNYLWRVNFDYRLSGNLQTMFNYSGRIQGKGKTIHTMRAEARAYL